MRQPNKKVGVYGFRKWTYAIEDAKQIEQNYKDMVANNKLNKVENIITGEVFENVEKAAERYNVKAKKLQKVLDGKRKYLGKNPLNNQKYEWRYAPDNQKLWFNEYRVI